MRGQGQPRMTHRCQVRRLEPGGSVCPERARLSAGHFGLFLSNFNRKNQPSACGNPWSVMVRTKACDAFGYPASELETCMKNANSPMQLTRAADYAVRVMIHLASPAGAGRVSLPALAQAAGAPVSFLSKVMQALSHAGLISSRRGQAGGFQISPRGRTASMREVIEAIDGAICLNVCLMSGRSCRRKASCPAHPVWVRAQQAMLDVLTNATVAGLAAQAAPVRAGGSRLAHPQPKAPVLPR
jgi:Rrf2 family protein